MQKLTISITCAMALAAVPFGGCGSSGGNGGGKAGVKKVVLENFTTKDPKSCTRIYTDRFLDYNYFGASQAKPQKCEKMLKGRLVPKEREVKISQVTVKGKTATAIGDGPGSPVKYTLKLRGGDWKINAVDIP